MTELARCNHQTMDKVGADAREHDDLQCSVRVDCDTGEAKNVAGARTVFCGMQVFICQFCRRELGL